MAEQHKTLGYICLCLHHNHIFLALANHSQPSPGLDLFKPERKALSAPIQNSKNKKSRLLKASFNSSSTPWSIDFLKSALSINNSVREDMNLPYCRYERIMLMTGDWLELPTVRLDGQDCEMILGNSVVSGKPLLLGVYTSHPTMCPETMLGSESQCSYLAASRAHAGASNSPRVSVYTPVNSTASTCSLSTWGRGSWFQPGPEKS